MIPDDTVLLNAFIAGRDAVAFRALVDRHLGLVHSVAKRITSNEDLARDVSQETFIRLASKAARIPRDLPLPAWLHRTARSIAIDLVRAEVRRKKREQVAMDLEANRAPEMTWRELSPVIDELIDHLPEGDRQLILSRYFSGNSYAEMATRLGMPEESVRRRGSRAVGKLRDLLARRGITTTASALATLLPAQVFGAAAPVGMAGSVASLALAAKPATSLILLDRLIALGNTTKTAIVMKPLLLVPPTIALLVAGSWIASDSRTLASLEKRNSSLQASLTDDRLSASADSIPVSARKATAAESYQTADGRIDWARVADSGFGVVGKRAFLEFSEALKSMTADELVSVLDQLRDSGLDSFSQQSYECRIIPLLGEKAPQVVLDRYADQLAGKGRIQSALLGVLSAWAGKDATAAAAWLDRMTGSGKLDDKDLKAGAGSIARYESALIGGLLRQDPAAAASRIKSLPPDQRLSVFQSGYYLENVPPGSEKASADLIRSVVPEQDRANTLAQATTDMIHSRYGLDLGSLSNYLAAIDPTPQERSAILESAVRYSGRQGYQDSAIAFVKSLAPDDANRLTGMALAARVSNTGSGDYFPEMAKIAKQQQADSGNDEVMISFLGNLSATFDPAEAISLAETVKDEAQRAVLRKHLEALVLENSTK